jgi:hypothetical protein
MDNKPVIGVAVAVVAIAAGSWFYFRHRNEAPPVITPEPITRAVEEPAPEAVIEHPLPPAEPGAQTALPSLAESDAPLLEALGKLAGQQPIATYLKPEGVVRNIVVTIDNLPRQRVALDKRPVPAVGGSFVVQGDELHATLDPQNYERYRPLVAVIDKLSMQQLAQLYFHYYPLFQDSYQNLGYPNGYFNDRLVQVIDVLLATPQPQGTIELVRPNVLYTFADPALEARPAGQKLLIRMGPDNAAKIKSKLMQLRAIITNAPPPKH